MSAPRCALRCEDRSRHAPAGDPAGAHVSGARGRRRDRRRGRIAMSAFAGAAAQPLTETDVARIRAEFPILKERPHGKPLVFLDSAASSQKPIQVIDAMDDYYRRYHANIHRGVYHISELATEAYEEARRKVAHFIGAPSAAECIYVRNATEALNLVAYSWGRTNLRRGDAIVLTEMEH